MIHPTRTIATIPIANHTRRHRNHHCTIDCVVVGDVVIETERNFVMTHSRVIVIDHGDTPEVVVHRGSSLVEVVVLLEDQVGRPDSSLEEPLVCHPGEAGLPGNHQAEVVLDGDDDLCDLDDHVDHHILLDCEVVRDDGCHYYCFVDHPYLVHLVLQMSCDFLGDASIVRAIVVLLLHCYWLALYLQQQTSW